MRIAIAPAMLALLLLSACGSEPREGGEAVPLNTTIENRGAPVDSITNGMETPPVAAPAAEPENALPVAFRGRWTGLEHDCSDQASDLRLTTSDTQMRFYESVGTVTAVSPEGPNAVMVDATYEGEGQTWSRRQKLTLSADGTRLTIADQSNATVRKRCSDSR